MSSKNSHEWWKRATFYHIYTMSFMDSNDDGIGDIGGIIHRLDYLKWLGIDALWISPIYPSSFYDNGYDIKDFTSIDPVFGTMNQFEELLNLCHSKDIKLILDYVSNHTSFEHPWFKQACLSRNNAKRDWYIWSDPNPNGGPPNNWLSTFGGSGWEYDATSNQYYYHSFYKEQPDLNWRNPEVQKAMFDVLRFWLDKGVDGFRVDVMWYLLKDKLLRNNPPNPKCEKNKPSYYQLNPAFSTDQPEIHEIISKMRSLVDSYGEKLLLGEVYLPADELVNYYGMEEPGAHLPGNYLLVMEEWNAAKIYDGICNYEASLPKEEWPNWVLSNHDHPRIASKIGKEQARMATLLMLTSRGTPIIYYGDEIGMQDVAISKSQMKDKAEQARDPQRTPFQWSSNPNAGFSKVEPWVEIPEDYTTINMENQKDDPTSFLNFYRELIKLRKQESILVDGIFVPVGLEGDIFAFIRKDQNSEKSFLIVCNFGHKSAVFQVPEYFKFKAEVIYGTDHSRKGKTVEKEIKMAGDEAFIAKMKG